MLRPKWEIYVVSTTNTNTQVHVRRGSRKEILECEEKHFEMLASEHDMDITLMNLWNLTLLPA